MNPRLCLLLVPLLSSPTLPASEIYKWVDPQGVTHFSDHPPANRKAEKLDIKPSDISVMRSASKGNVSQPAAPEPKAGDKSPYKSVKITSPANDQAVRANDGVVKIECQVTPALDTRRHHKLRFIIDGKPLGSVGTTCDLTLNAVDRGTHSVAVEVIDKQGKTLLRSATHTFHVKRVSAL